MDAVALEKLSYAYGSLVAVEKISITGQDKATAATYTMVAMAGYGIPARPCPAVRRLPASRRGAVEGWTA